MIGVVLRVLSGPFVFFHLCPNGAWRGTFGRPLALRAGYRRLAALKMHTFRVYMFRIPSCLLVILQVELDVRNQPVFP